MRRNIISECQKIISKKLFYLDNTLRQPLIEIRTEALNINQSSFFDEKLVSNPISLQEFKEQLDQFRQQRMVKYIQMKQSEILEIL